VTNRLYLPTAWPGCKRATLKPAYVRGDWPAGYLILCGLAWLLAADRDEKSRTRVPTVDSNLIYP